MRVEAEVELIITCNVCGRELEWSNTRRNNGIAIAPCDRCLSGAKKEADSDAYDRGYDQGHQDAETESKKGGI